MPETEKIMIPQPTSQEELHPFQNHGLRPPHKKVDPATRPRVVVVSPWLAAGNGQSGLDKTTPNFNSVKRTIEKGEYQKSSHTRGNEKSEMELTGTATLGPSAGPAQLSLDLSFLGSLD